VDVRIKGIQTDNAIAASQAASRCSMKSASFPVIPAVLKGSRKPVLLEAIEGGFIHYFYTYTHTCTHTYT
jgi:hypothetical protein